MWLLTPYVYQMMLMMGRLVSIRDPVLARVEYRKLTLHVSDYTTTHVSVQP